MLTEIKNTIKDKKVLILGFGREGISTYNIIKDMSEYKCLDIADKFPLSIDVPKKHKCITGDSYLDFLNDYDVLFKSPGVILDATKYTSLITSQMDIFIKTYKSQIIGVTGTKGKTTVSSLIYHVLNENNKDCLLAGNIGLPAFEIMEKITDNTNIVLELSCHQLQFAKYSPKISVLLNIYEDHLDYYKTFDDYKKTKLNIFLNQQKGDFLFHGENVSSSIKKCESEAISISLDDIKFNDFKEVDENIKIFGKHNVLNCAFAYNVCKMFDISYEDFLNALKSYVPLPHRLQYLFTKNDISFYDDSISTTVESAINAVNSVPNAKILILGGMDRGICYNNLVDFIVKSDLSNVILMYESGKKINDMLKDKCYEDAKFHYAYDLYEAVKLLKELAKPFDACILSPAAASYGHFKNFEERGDVFKSLCLEMF